MPEGIRYAIVVSDLHCGGTTALLPPGFKTLEGQEIGQSLLQKWLWEQWLRLQSDAMAIVGDSPFVLIVNGDCIDGNHHHTKQIISPDENDHVQAFLKTIRPLATKADKVLMSEGTEVHTRNSEHSIADILGAMPDETTGKPCWGRIDIEIQKSRSVFFHHMPTTSRAWLRTNALGAMLANEQLEAARADETLPVVLGMAHRHTPDSIQCNYGTAFVTAPWQLTTRYGGRVVPSARFIVGGAVVDYTESKPRLHQLTYRPAPAKPVQV